MFSLVHSTNVSPAPLSLIPLLAWDNTSVVCGVIVGEMRSVGTTISISLRDGRIVI